MKLTLFDTNFDTFDRIWRFWHFSALSTDSSTVLWQFWHFPALLALLPVQSSREHGFLDNLVKFSHFCPDPRWNGASPGFDHISSKSGHPAELSSAWVHAGCSTIARSLHAGRVLWPAGFMPGSAIEHAGSCRLIRSSPARWNIIKILIADLHWCQKCQN